MDMSYTANSTIIEATDDENCKELALKKKYLYTDLERQLFNIELSVGEFVRQSREMESRSLESKKRCRSLLKCHRHSSAWLAARKALTEERNSLLYNIASRKMKRLLDTVKKEDELEPTFQRLIGELDLAVRANDPGRVNDLISRLEAEHQVVHDDAVTEAKEVPNELDVGSYISKVQDEIRILDGLKELDGSHQEAECCTPSACLSEDTSQKYGLMFARGTKPKPKRPKQKKLFTKKLRFNLPDN